MRAAAARMIRVSHHAKPLLVPPPPRAPIRTSSLSAAAAAECDLIANGKRSVAGTGRVVCHAPDGGRWAAADT